MLELTLTAGAPEHVAEVREIVPDAAGPTTVLRVTVEGAGDWFHVGGALVGRGAPDVAALDSMPLMPCYAWERWPVITVGTTVGTTADAKKGATIGGRVFRSSMYVKLPVLVVECGGGAVGVSFPTTVRAGDRRVATWFALARVGTAIRFEVVVPASWTTLRKLPADYHEWLPTELVPETTTAPPGPWTTEPVRVVSGASVEDVLRRLAAALVPDAEAPDAQSHADRALRFLASVQDPATGAFLEWKRRGARGFLRGWFALPTYHRLAGTLARAARADSSLRAMAELTARPLLDPAATFAAPGGVVFHNSIRRDRLGRVRFYSHLGSGVAGYPGGQANAILSLACRVTAGSGTSADAALLRAAVGWMLAQRGDDGRLPRALRLVREPHETGLSLGPETRSDGADAEGAHALFAAAAACDEASWTAAGVGLLTHVEDAFAKRGHLRGYLRDNREAEPECVSHVAAIRAHLAARDVTGDAGHLTAAVRHGVHLAAWIRPARVTSLDTLVSSFGPRLAPCESLWAARAFHDLAAATGDALFARCAAACADVLRAEAGFPGWTEAHYWDETGVLHPHSFECVYSAEAVLEWAAAKGARIRCPAPGPTFHAEAPRSMLGRAMERWGPRR
ncbi:MAG: hypothetical protein K8T90_14245 [Planctomycetes bacterium]|nr:hypothetical protein [Planctomycetota bacterium]